VDRRLLILALALVGLAALPVQADAVLGGENGRIVLASGRIAGDGTAQLFLLPVPSSTGGGTISPAITKAATVQHRHPTWSPDRTKIAYAAGSPSCNPNKCDIFVLDLTDPNAEPVNLTMSPVINEDRPAWSPDGTRLAFETEVSNGSGQQDIYVDREPFGFLPTPGDVNLTSSAGVLDGKPAWSPDSQTLYYSIGNVATPPNGTNNDVKIFREPADNSGTATQAIHISGAHAFQPSISPDGQNICFTVGPTPGLNTSASIFVAPLSAPASASVLSSSGAGDYNCTWSPDGFFVAYVSGIFSTGRLVMERADNTSPFPIELAQDPGGDNFDGNPDWAPDARPVCPNSTVTIAPNQRVTFDVECTDTGPAYERTAVREFNTSEPTNGTLTQELAGDPFTYTPNAGFTGTDSFQVRSFDELGFGTDLGTVTINVRQPGGPGGAPRCAGRPATSVGGSGGVTILGTPRADVIAGAGTNDRIRGGRGNDVICGGRGNDRLSGGPGRDRVFGNSGRDRVLGDGGRDRLEGGSGPDRLSGGPGRDRLKGGSGRDRLNGGASRDICAGGRGRDRGLRCERRSSIP
jgi:Tol biopolymer transport system component